MDKPVPACTAEQLKVWLDDERAAPAGWTTARWPADAIQLLQTCKVTHISLDHDLGDDSRGTGYDVIAWIEAAVRNQSIIPPIITVHSANPAARIRMLAGIEAIQRFVDGRV